MTNAAPMTAAEIVEALCGAQDNAEYAQTKCYLMPDDDAVKKELESACAHRDRIKAALVARLKCHESHYCYRIEYGVNCPECDAQANLEEACR